MTHLPSAAEHEEERIIDGHKVFASLRHVNMYDENQEFIATGTLDDVIERDLWCRSVHVWMVNSKGELYLQKRSMHVINNPGKWSESGGGYVDGNATNIETAVNEIGEEIGIDIEPSALQSLGVIKQYETRHDGTTGKQFVEVFLVCVESDMLPIALDLRDVGGMMTIAWEKFKAQYEKGEIDFVDHKEEITLVFEALEKVFPKSA
jgi:isopentenyldiphosphate isomerase